MNTKSPKQILALLNRFWRNLSFRKKTILYTSMILYIFVLLFGLLIYNRAVQSMSRMTQQSVSQRLQSLDAQMKARLANYTIITSTLLLDNNFQDKLEQCPASFVAASEYDNGLVDYLDALCASSLISAEWNLYFAYERPTSIYSNIQPLREAEDTAWFRQLTAQKRNMITWCLDAGSPDIPGHFLCSIGIQNRTSRSLPAYFKMDVPLESVISPIRTATEDMDSVFLLCSQSGELLWCSDGDMAYADYILPYEDSSPLEPVTVTGGLGERTVIPLDGEKYGYMVFCVRNDAHLLGNYVNFSRYFLVTLSLIIILSLFILICSARLVDGRIVALTADIKAMDENNLNYQGDMSSLDEVGELSRAFVGLIERIRMLIERERQFELERFELEIQALQAQINPHFLFNTLSIINLLAREIEADHISEALEALANFYHFSLSDDKKTTTVRHELTMLDYYLKICSIRYRNRLQVDKNIDPLALDCNIPKLIVQPFCENAVFHGFSAYSAKMPKLGITVRRMEDHLLIVISDNGEGMSEENLKRTTETGFAISNVNRRIQMLYGTRYGVSISSVPGEGTQVSIRLGLSDVSATEEAPD